MSNGLSDWARALFPDAPTDEEAYGYREVNDSPPYRPASDCSLPDVKKKPPTPPPTVDEEIPLPADPFKRVRVMTDKLINHLQQPLSKPVAIDSATSSELAAVNSTAEYYMIDDSRTGPVSDWNSNIEYVLKHIIGLLDMYQIVVKENENTSMFTSSYDRIQAKHNNTGHNLLITSFFTPPSIADMMEKTVVFFCPKGNVGYRQLHGVYIRPISQSIIEYSCQGFTERYPNYDDVRADRINYKGEYDFYVEYVTSFGGYDVFIPHMCPRRPTVPGLAVDFTPFTKAGEAAYFDPDSKSSTETYFVKTQLKSAIFFQDILYCTGTQDELLPVPISVLRDTRLHLIATTHDKDFYRTAARFAAKQLKDMDLPPDLTHKISNLIARMVMASQIQEETMALTALVTENSGMFKAFNAALNFEPMKIVSKHLLLSVLVGLLVFGIILYNDLPYVHHSLAIVVFSLSFPILAYFFAPNSLFKAYISTITMITADVVNTGLFFLKQESLPPWIFILIFFILLLSAFMVVHFYSLSTSSSTERIQNSIPTEGSTQYYAPNMPIKRLVSEVRPKESAVRESLKVLSPGEDRRPKKEATSVVSGPIVPSNDYVVSVEGTSTSSVLAALETRQGKDTRPQGETYTRMITYAQSEDGLLPKLRKAFDVTNAKSIFVRWVSKFPAKKQDVFRKAKAETEAPGFFDHFKPNVTSVFGKLQKSVFAVEDGETVVKAQRIIISPADHVKVLCGPWIQEVTRQFKDYFRSSDKFIYAPGNTNDVIGDKMYQFYCSSSKVYFIEADLSKADASIDRPVHTMFKNFLNSLKIPKFVADFLHPEIVVYTNRNGLFAVDSDPRLGSGRDDTSLLMTLVVMMFWDWFLTSWYPVTSLISAGGDDSLCLIKGKDIDSDKLNSLVKDTFKTTSFDATVLVTDRPYLVTFYSKILVPCFDSSLRTETWCLVPMPGRLIARLAVDVHLLDPVDKVSQYNTLLNDCVFTPFIAIYLRHFLGLFREIADRQKKRQGRKPPPLLEEWATHNNNKALIKTTNSYDFFEKRYGLVQSDENSLEEYLKTITSPYVILDHYVLQALIKVDN